MFFSGKTREFVLTCGRQKIEFVQTWWKRSSYIYYIYITHALYSAACSDFFFKVCHILTKYFKKRKKMQNSVSYGHLSNRFLSFDCKAKEADTIAEDTLLLTLSSSWINVWFSCVILQLPEDYPGLAPM